MTRRPARRLLMPDTSGWGASGADPPATTADGRQPTAALRGAMGPQSWPENRIGLGLGYRRRLDTRNLHGDGDSGKSAVTAVKPR